jgi:hypothetical protein
VPGKLELPSGSVILYDFLHLTKLYLFIQSETHESPIYILVTFEMLFIRFPSVLVDTNLYRDRLLFKIMKRHETFV